MGQQSCDWSRRRVLSASTLGAAGLALGGGSLLLPAQPASAHSPLVSHNEIDDQLTYHFSRATGQLASPDPYNFQYNSTFYGRLESWLEFFYANTPGNWLKPMTLYISDTHRDTVIDGTNTLSMHAYGKAMDLCRLNMTTFTSTTQGNIYYMFQAFNARGNEINEPLGSTTWKRYWGGVASLMYYFDYTLHYYYAGHQDHVHADITNGTGNTRFSTVSPGTQVGFVQAALRNIWGYSTTIDSYWGSQTDSHSRSALARIGRSGGLTTSQANWLEFCRATTRFGTGKQAY
jgi:hypothetical protein